MNKLFHFLLLCSGVFLSTTLLANESNAQKKGKVVVSHASEFAEITEHVPEFSVLSDLVDYLSENMTIKPDETIKVLVAFQKTMPTLSPEQLSNLNLLWTQNLVLLGQYEKAQNKVKQVSSGLLSSSEKLTYFLIHADLLAKTHDLFAAINSYKQAFELATEQKLLKVSNQVALKLADLYFELNAQKSAQSWLDKVEYEISDSTELSILLETGSQLAQLQQQLKQYTLAESTLTQIIDYLAEKDLDLLQASLRFQLAELYVDWQKFELARKALEQNFVFAQQNRNTAQQAQALIGLMELALMEESPWRANQVLTQADKLEPYIFDQDIKLAFWQTKAKVLASRGYYRRALAVLVKYEQTAALDDADLLPVLDKKLAWQAKTGQLKEVQDTFNRYRELSQRVANLTSTRQLSFVQQSHQHDKEQAQILSQESQTKVQALELEAGIKQNRITALYIVIFLLVVAAGLSLYWLYRKFSYEKDLDSLADPVSLAYNHRFLSRQFEYLKRKGHRISLVMFDIDKMLDINAQLGHELADHLMYQLVARLNHRLFKNTWLIRTSGDRFVVLANNFDHKQVFILAEILRKELNSKEFKISKHKVKLRASFAALECLPEEDLEAVKLRLKLAVSEAKLQGGNQTLQR